MPIAKYMPLFKRLRAAKSRSIARLLSKMTSSQVHAVCECIYNTLHTNLGVSPKKMGKLKKTLAKNRSVYRYLADKRNPVSKKRALMVQHGSGIGMLLGAIIPALVSLFAPKPKPRR